MNQKDFEKKQKKILATIPEEFHVFFKELASDYAHTTEPEEVLFCLDNLITDDFKVALKKYSDRIVVEAIQEKEAYESSGD